MYSAFSTALSALNGTAVAVDIIGNNLANMNTPGFKTSTVSFHDLVTQSLAGAEVGLGTARPDSTRQFTQGAIQASGGALDAGIQGEGFFVVRNQSGQQLFTRAGNFHLDAAGNLMTQTGENVQGWVAVNGPMDTSGAPTNITLPVGALRPGVATSTMSLDLNLDASTAKDGTFSAPIEVVDSLGAKHVVTVTFTKTDTNSWSYAITVPGADVTAGKAGTPFPIQGATGTLVFDPSGQLKTPDPTKPMVNFTIPGLTDGAADMNLNWDLYSADNNSRLTQFAQPSAISATNQDGSPAGQITSLLLQDGGVIVARYSNGQQQTVAQLALASIRNPESLIAAGNNDLASGADTAAAAIGTAETGGRGKVLGGSLESSTVDIAHEFTNLIVMQRSYQANARVITATDELSQETINLKR